MIIKGIVSRVRFGREGRTFIVTDGLIDYTFSGRDNIAQGSSVVIEGEAEGTRLQPSGVVVLSGDEAAEVRDAVKERIRQGMPKEPSLVDDEVSRRLWPLASGAAAELLCAKKLGRSILLRFHGDADGISGALALSALIYMKTYQQNSAIYSVREALRDISAVGQENEPLVVLLDFGSNDESAEGLGLLRAAGIQSIVIDHHPPGAKAPEHIVNPLTFESSAAHYTAGYIACEIAQACGLEKEKALELAKVACSGDKSTLIPNGAEERRKAMVLDFLAAHTSFGNNLDFYKKVMGKKELFDSIAQQADDAIEEAATKAMARAKNEGMVVTFPLDHVVKKGEWPSASKITTRIFEKLAREGPLLCIGHTERSLIIRLNDAAAAKGMSANGLARHVTGAMADFVEGGGGHIKAGAIRVKAGFAKDVLSELLRAVKSQAGEG